MNIKINIVVHSENAVKDATEITNTFKDENIRGVKVNQPQAAAERGALSMAEYLPLIELVVKSGLATAVVTQVFSLLQNGFFTKSKEIAANEKIEMAKIASAEEQAKQKNDLTYLELQLEHNGKKQSFKLPGNEKERKLILNELVALVDNK